MARKDALIAFKASTKEAVSGIEEIRKAIIDMVTGAENSKASALKGAALLVTGINQGLEIMSKVSTTIIEGTRTAIELVQFAAERQRLFGLASAGTLDTLRSATRGLVDDTTLLQTAALGMQGEFALTESQMGLVAQAAVRLHEQGLGPVPKILNDITEALHKGAVGKLDDYGIVVDGAKTKTEGMARAMEKLAAIATSSSASTAQATDGLTQGMVELKNAFDTIKDAIGATIGGLGLLTGAFGRFLGESAAKMITWNADYTDGVKLATEAENERYWAVRRSTKALAEMAEKQRQLAEQERTAKAIQNQADQIELLSYAWQNLHGKTKKKAMEEIQEGTIRDASAIESLIKKEQAEVAKAAEKAHREAVAAAKKAWEEFLKPDEIKTIGDTIFEQTGGSIEDDLRKRINAQIQAGLEAQRAFSEQQLSLLPEQKKPKDDPYRHLKLGAAAYKKEVDNLKGGLDELADAGGRAFAMLISGQEGAGAAAADAIREFLRAQATESAAMALKSAGWAAYDFAVGNIPGAVKALEAAAIFAGFAAAYGGGAAIAGATSSEREAGAREAGTGGDRRNTAGFGAASSGEGGVSVTIHNHFGYGFAGDSKAVARFMDRATRESAARGYIATRNPATRRVS